MVQRNNGPADEPTMATTNMHASTHRTLVSPPNMLKTAVIAQATMTVVMAPNPSMTDEILIADNVTIAMMMMFKSTPRYKAQTP